MNMEGILARSVVSSSWFKHVVLPLPSLPALHRLICDDVTSVEAWGRGGGGDGRAASEAFMCAFRCALFGPTRKDLTAMINYRDNDYVRAVAFIYIRFVCPPFDLWDWFGPHCDDPTPFKTASAARAPTM